MNVIAGSQPPWYPLPPAWRVHAVQTPDSVLLETAGGLGSDHVSYLFTLPEKVLRAASAQELIALLEDVEGAAQDGFYAAGRIGYEAAYALHDMPSAASPRPLACFGLYREPLRFDHHSGVASGQALSSSYARESISAKAILSLPHMGLDRERYASKFEAVQRFLAAGDTYQVNLTTHVDADLLGSPLALYEALIDAQPVDFAAILNFDDSLTLSFSPELFFRIEGACILTRPMKGTAPRGETSLEDARQSAWLASDEKNHAEHVMIVDLLRNDLGRICESGSVRADDLFRIEPYPTLFQMTSTVSGALRSDVRFSEIIRALFPSGSVTGAPKRRTMEIIRDLEDSPRGVYTGAIGFVSPAGDACFSVPIRTLDVKGQRVSMGVGGGVVADSTAVAEYDECLLKASFLSEAASAPRLIETLHWKDGYTLLDLHLERLSASATQLGFEYDPSAIRSALNAASSEFQEEKRVRLLLSTSEKVEIESGAITGPSSNLRVRIAARRILSTDHWRRHKTTRRALYDRELARARLDGFDEVLFLNERDELAEGAISTIFIKAGGKFYTPPLSSGALPGVERQLLLRSPKRFAERTLYLNDLASTELVYLCNSVRGLRPVGSLYIE
jgi:para-aminobenzoate synthetase/4-amino-4-deoxychorismate lyase